MNRMKNENGYALIIVLLVIVVITLTTAVFMNASISTAKQEQIVDRNNMAVVAAEMGMDYYLNYIGNEEKKAFHDVQTEVSERFVCEENMKQEECRDQLQKDAEKMYSDKLDEILSGFNLEDRDQCGKQDKVKCVLTVDEHSSKLIFKLETLERIYPNNDVQRKNPVVLKVEVDGVSPTKTKRLFATLAYTLPKIGVEEVSIEIPSKGPNPINDPSDVFKFFLPEQYLKEDPCPGNGNCRKNGDVYSTSKDFYNYTNPNSMSNFTWFHNGTLDAKNNMNNMDAKIILKSLGFKNNIEVSGSLVLVGGNNNSGKITLEKKGNGNLTTSGNGKICINLDGYRNDELAQLTVNGNFIYFSSKPNASWPGKGSEGEKYDGSLSDFISECTDLSPIQGGEEGNNSNNGKSHLIYFESNNVNLDVKIDY